MERSSKHQTWVTALTAAVFIISWAGFILTPLTGDLQVLLAGSRQADYLTGNWLVRSFRAWDMKGEFLRAFLYVLYRAATVFVPFGTAAFERICNVLYSLLIVLTAALCVRVARGKRAEGSVLCTMGISAAFFATLPMTHIQAEMTGVLILAFAFAIYWNAKRTEHGVLGKLFISGLLIGSLFFYKSILILMSVAFVAAAMLWNGEYGKSLRIREFFTIVAGSVVMLAVGCGMIYVINPSEFQNMADAAVYQSTMLSGTLQISLLRIARNFGGVFFYMFLACPVIMVGFLLAIRAFFFDLRERRWFRCLLRLVLWGMPASIVIIAYCWFPYHHFSFVFSALAEIILTREWETLLLGEQSVEPRKAARFLLVCVLCGVILFVVQPRIDHMMLPVLVCLYVAAVCGLELLGKKRLCTWMEVTLPLAAALAAYVVLLSPLSAYQQDTVALNRAMYENNKSVQLELEDGEEVLYLDAGSGAYLIGAKSYLPEYYPLPLERISEESPHRDRACHTRALQRAMAYEGAYVIVSEGWFFENGRINHQIAGKLHAEYEKVGTMDSYSIECWITGPEAAQQMDHLDIYRRKSA